MVTKPDDVEKVLTGKKTATRRNGRYADPGEIMVLQGKRFKVERVYRETLGDLTDESAVQEGFNNLEEYKNAILAIHPGMPWKAEMKVWVHEFKEV
ncbi:ASCH domain-containing protein [Salipaludibacillus aurantiacus]|nr:ASCH domain-containing protein [Salipaludibacillus aurantiacus]